MTPAAALLLSLADDPPADASLTSLLCRRGSDTLGVDGTALTAVRPGCGSLGLVDASDAEARAHAEAQLRAGEGPAHDAVRTGEVVAHPDLATPGRSRWPRYAAATRGTRLGAVFAFPVRVGSVRVGSFDLFRRSPGALHAAAHARALVFADAALLILLHLADEGRHPYGFGPADETRSDVPGTHDEVRRATAIVADQAGVGPRDALLLLRAHALVDGASLRRTARAVLANRLRFGCRDAPGS